MRDASSTTGHGDDFANIPGDVQQAQLYAAVPSQWQLTALREHASGEHFAGLTPGTVWEVEGGDTVTGAPELVRLSLNIAYAHTDATASTYRRRLVYGGHTISLAAAHATRALPNIAWIVAWRSCDHLAPVFEGDILRTVLTLEDKHPLADGGLLDLHAEVFADREDESAEHAPVLDWRFVALMP
jgi:acyl dehydratase